MAAKTIEIDSIPYYTLVEGPQDGKLVVLIHALMANMEIWNSTVPALNKAGYKTLRYDHVGHNKTGPPSDSNRSFHFDDFTRHIQHIIQTRCPDEKPYALVGCSIGGVLVLRYAQMYPGSAQKIISCAAPGAKSLEVSKPKWASRIEQFKAEGTVDNLAVSTIERWFPDPCEPSIREKALEITKTCTLPGYEICAKCTTNYDYSGELEQIRKEQVLILAGENDSNIGPKKVLVDVHKKIKGSKYVLMKDTGHIPPQHQPADFEKILLDFLQE